MEKKFNLDKSLYVMMVFIGVIGVILLVVRSDFILQNEFFDVKKGKTVRFASEEAIQSFKKPDYLIITEAGQEQLNARIIARLEKMGKNAVSVPADQFEAVDGDYEGVVAAAENLDLIQDPSSLLRYVKSGGALFFALRPAPGTFLSAVYQQLGMTEIGSFIETSGLEFAEPPFKTEGSRVFESEELVNSSLRVRLSPSADLHLSSGQGVPLLWKMGYGKGQFVFFNGTILSEPSGSGLLTRGLQLLSPGSIHPIVNAAPTVLRGFPFPVPDGRFKDGKLAKNDFFRHVFWPAMLRVEAKHDLNYTSAFVSDSADFQANGLSGAQEDLILYGREILRFGGEMGVEGYSKQPREEQEPVNLEKVYTDVSQRMEQALPGYNIHSYMPVNQEGLSEHFDALVKSFTGITNILVPEKSGTKPLEDGPKTVSAMQKANGDGRDGADERKEKPNPAGKEMALLPETFKGFVPDAFSKWLVINGLLADGYFTQTIEPQSFLLENEDEEILVDYERFAAEMDSEVPWLQRPPLSEAAASVLAANRQTVYTEKTKEGMTFHVNKVSSPSYFFFFTDKKIKKSTGCKVAKVGHQLYLVESSKLSFSIGLE